MKRHCERRRSAAISSCIAAQIILLWENKNGASADCFVPRNDEQKAWKDCFVPRNDGIELASRNNYITTIITFLNAQFRKQ